LPGPFSCIRHLIPFSYCQHVSGDHDNTWMDQFFVQPNAQASTSGLSRFYNADRGRGDLEIRPQHEFRSYFGLNRVPRGLLPPHSEPTSRFGITRESIPGYDPKVTAWKPWYQASASSISTGVPHEISTTDSDQREHQVSPEPHAGSQRESSSKSPESLPSRSTAIPQAYHSMLAGAGAGLVSSIVTCPLDVVKTRLQAQVSRKGAADYEGVKETINRIWRSAGIRGLYRGLGPTVLGYLPTWGIYFSVYDQIKNSLTPDGKSAILCTPLHRHTHV